MRQYDDQVEVRRGQVTTGDGPGGPVEGPEQFLWRGRLWKVRAVLAHWVETGPWWQSSGVRAVIGTDETASGSSAGSADLLAEREMWRVEAGRGADDDPTTRGVFDLSFSWDDGRWQLVGCAD
jgi:Family of unknown function (DUF6504)